MVQPLVLGQGQALFDQLPGSRHRVEALSRLVVPSGIVHIYGPQHT